MLRVLALFCALISGASAFADVSFENDRPIQLDKGLYAEMPVILKSDHTFEAYLRKLEGSFDDIGGQGYYVCESVIKGAYQASEKGYFLDGIGAATVKPCFTNVQCLSVQIESELIPGLRGKLMELAPLTQGSISPISSSLPSCN